MSTDDAADVAKAITRLFQGIEPKRRRAAYCSAVCEWQQWEDQASENERAHADALRAILAQRPGGPLTDQNQRPGDGWEWTTDSLTEFPIVDGESKCRSQVATGWVPPRVVAWRKTPNDWPPRTPSLEVTLLILALYHDLALPRAPRLMDDAEVEASGAVKTIRRRFQRGRLADVLEEPGWAAAQASAGLAKELVAHAETLLRAQGAARDHGPSTNMPAVKAADLGEQVAEPTKEHDAFLCHASDDKGAVVRPFADLMREHGLKAWLDEREIKWGHNLAKKIQEGLARSRFVVVFLSSAFLSKKGWTDKELNTALSMDDGEHPLVLPVVLGITHEELESKYPLVSAKKYHKIPDYDPAKQVPPGELNKLLDELKNMIGVPDRRGGRGRP